LTVVSNLAVYSVAESSSPDGVNVAVLVASLYATAPATGEPPVGRTVNDEPVSVAGSIDRENTTDTDADRATPPAPTPGDRDTTDGGPRLETVKVQV
jgi:hypothetical protein